MSRTKTIVVGLLVLLALLATGLGGLQDLGGVRLPMSKEHGWNDGLFLMLAAILAAIILR